MTLTQLHIVDPKLGAIVRDSLDFHEVRSPEQHQKIVDWVMDAITKCQVLEMIKDRVVDVVGITPIGHLRLHTNNGRVASMEQQGVIVDDGTSFDDMVDDINR